MELLDLSPPPHATREDARRTTTTKYTTRKKQGGRKDDRQSATYMHKEVRTHVAHLRLLRFSWLLCLLGVISSHAQSRLG